MQPSSQNWIPERYQLTALSFVLANLRGGLFLDPGLGKTAICLSAIRILQTLGKTRGNLIIAPLRVIYEVWPEEIEKWGNFNDISYTILHDVGKEAIWKTNSDIYLINPEGLPWLHQELLAGLSLGDKCPFNAVWVDESSKFKSHDSSRFKLLCDMLPLFSRRHVLTGTPAPRSLMNLWPQMYLLDEGRALESNFYEFRKMYFTKDEWNKYQWNLDEGANNAISEAIAPLVLEMKSEGKIKLPPVVYNDIKVSLPEHAFKQYKRMERDFFAELDQGDITADAAAQASLRCHQMANGRVYEDIPEELTEEERRAFMRTRRVFDVHTRKAEALLELMDELNGKPLLLAYHFKHDLEAIEDVLGRPVPFIGSGTTPKRTAELRRLWNAGKLPILAGHPQSMGYGLNMQYGQGDVGWYTLPWSLEMYIQFNKRVLRRGAKSTIRIHHFVAKNTVDLAILQRLGENAAQQQDLRDAIRAYRRSLTSSK